MTVTQAQLSPESKTRFDQILADFGFSNTLLNTQDLAARQQQTSAAPVSSKEPTNQEATPPFSDQSEQDSSSDRVNSRELILSERRIRNRARGRISSTSPESDPVVGLVSQTRKNEPDQKSGLASSSSSGSSSFDFDQSLKDFGFNPRLLASNSGRINISSGPQQQQQSAVGPQQQQQQQQQDPVQASSPVINPFRQSNIINSGGRQSSGLSNLLAIAGDPKVMMMS